MPEDRTILLSSHLLAEVEALCDRVTIIRDGRAVESGTLAQPRHLTRTSVTADLTPVPDSLAGLPGVHDLTVTGTLVGMEVDAEHLEAVLRVLTQAGLRGLTCQPPALEQLFLRHYQVSAS